ncbi:MAG: alpha/beta hydrolase [Oscillospiraceae bacterium]|nr:alpha/beta hydrolase [Oscillospiraceae bacterium]
MIVKRDCIYTPKGKNRPLHIYLPDDYTNGMDRYPVLYFFDGHNLFSDDDATYGKCWGLKEFLDGWDQKLILVGIECGHEGDERLSEYLPYGTLTPAKFSMFRPMGRATMEWIVGEVKPMIDRDYRTLPDREFTGIGGSSMGGLMALYAGARYNHIFSKAACVSSAIGFCVRAVMRGLRSAEIRPNSRFYLSWGTKEAYGCKHPDRDDRSSRTYKWNRRAADELEKKGAQVMLYCQVGGAHCEADWEKQNPIYMDYLWK